jgi:glycosyltransferase involved in cell wall biosynthesis
MSARDAVNIVVVHNFYQQAGGEDQVFADESSLLESHGHSVQRYTVHNSAVESMGKLKVAAKTIWNREAAAALAQVVRQTKASIVHFHNTFPLLSPAVYQAVRKEGAAVVQTLHNYRLMCPAATLFRDGHVCEDCVGKAIPLAAIKHSCYRGSKAASAAVSVMLTVHGARGTYRNDIDAYIALTEFSRGKFVQGGIPAKRIFVKPNFVSPDPDKGSGKGGYAVFVGRLTVEKGVPFLLNAWKKIGNRFPLKILGDGPLRCEVEAAAGPQTGIHYLGRKRLSEIYDIVGEASALVFPSLWYEGLPRTIVEAFAKGTPVLASRLGSMAELVKDGVNGILFDPGNEADLVTQVDRLIASGEALRDGARREFESKYTAEANYPALMSIYDAALNRAEATGITGSTRAANTVDAAGDAARDRRERCALPS